MQNIVKKLALLGVGCLVYGTMTNGAIAEQITKNGSTLTRNNTSNLVAQNSQINNQTTIINNSGKKWNSSNNYASYYAPQKSNWYLGGSVGLVLPSDVNVSGLGNVKFDNTVGYNVFAGYQFSPQYRGDLEVSYSNPKVTNIDANVSKTAFMANGYYDLPSSGSIKPYLGAGVGFASLSGKANTASTDKTVFAYQVKAGAGYQVADNTDLFLQYRYAGTGNVDNNIGSVNSHNIEIGAKFGL